MEKRRDIQRQHQRMMCRDWDRDKQRGKRGRKGERWKQGGRGKGERKQASKRDKERERCWGRGREGTDRRKIEGGRQAGGLLPPFIPPSLLPPFSLPPSFRL